MSWMYCTTCKSLVHANATGTCLSCQRGFVGIKQEDSWFKEKEEFLIKKISELQKNGEEYE